MAAINTGKAFLGGLVSGVVLFLGDALANNVLMQAEWEALLKRLNIDMATMQTLESLAGWVGSDLALGILMVWTYAAIRPRFGPGPKTALVAGMLLFVTITLVMYGFMSIGVFTQGYFLKSSLIYFVIFSLSSMAGAYFYSEN